MTGTRSIRHAAGAAFAALALTATVTVAQAGTDKAPELRVSYADLDLSTPEGITVLYVRVREAARRLCEPLRLRTGTRVSDSYDTCVREAIGATGRRLKTPALMALYAGETRRSVIGSPRSAEAQRPWVLM